MRPLLALAPIFAFGLPACGPSVANEDVFPRNCGEDGPVDLFEPGEALVLSAQVVGDYVVMELRDEDFDEVIAVERCGAAAHTLTRRPAGEAPWLDVVGEQVLACDEATGRIDRLDPAGEAPPLPLFDATSGCNVYSVAGGLAARNLAAGTIEFVVDPAAPEPAPEIIVEDASHLEDEHTCDEPVGCRYWSMANELASLGEVLLVPRKGGGLVTVDPRTGATTTITDQPTVATYALEQGRFAMWAVDFHETFLFDSATGISVKVGTWHGWVIPLGEWIFDSPLIPYSSGVHVSALHLPSGRSHTITTDVVLETIDEKAAWTGWEGEHALSSESLIVQIPDDMVDPESPRRSHVYWPATGEIEPVDLSGVARVRGDRVVTEVGIFTFVDAVQFLPREGPGPRTLLEDRPRVVGVTAGGRLIYADGASLGTLRVVDPHGVTHEVDRDVSRPISRRPAAGVLHDDAELVYLAEADGRPIVRRTVLP